MKISEDINTSELKALIRLVEDPDPTIFMQVKSKLLSYGKPIVSDIQNAWLKDSIDNQHQEKLVEIIKDIQFEDVKLKLTKWKESSNRDLLKGSVIVSQFQFPEITEESIEIEIEKIKQKVWLEINEENTAFEIVKIFNHVLFDLLGFEANKTNFHSPYNSYISALLKNKKGNPLSLSVLYSIIAQKLEIPIYGVNLPNQFVLGFLDENRTLQMLDKSSNRNVLFYINPFSKGRIFDYNEIETYLRSLNLPLKENYFEPCSNTDILKRMITNLIHSYHKIGEHKKSTDLKELMLIL